MDDEDWANAVVGNVLDLADVRGAPREGKNDGAVLLKLETLQKEWSNWSADDITSLVRIMTGRRLVARVAGKNGEELRVHPDARKMHESFMQRLVAFEEEEEANFIEDELLAEKVSAGELAGIVMPPHVQNGSGRGNSAGTPPPAPFLPPPQKLPKTVLAENAGALNSAAAPPPGKLEKSPAQPELAPAQPANGLQQRQQQAQKLPPPQQQQQQQQLKTWATTPLSAVRTPALPTYVHSPATVTSPATYASLAAGLPSAPTTSPKNAGFVKSMASAVDPAASSGRPTLSKLSAAAAATTSFTGVRNSPISSTSQSASSPVGSRRPFPTALSTPATPTTAQPAGDPEGGDSQRPSVAALSKLFGGEEKVRVAAQS
ncbi:hypothetical protein DIPPA_25455 [Diplonema papillatum]|nr:hypothetical protein DIPPA_25455 [Diplonema papillatum]|eukprot:gene10133-15579_t